MENQQTKLDKAAKISIVVGSLMIALSIAYYLVIFLPKSEVIRWEQQKEAQDAKRNEQEANKTKLFNCINSLGKAKSDTWDTACKSLGLKNDCRLPSENADNIEKSIEAARSDCFRLFPQN